MAGAAVLRRADGATAPSAKDAGGRPGPPGPSERPGQDPAHRRRLAAARETAQLVAVAALVVAACLPLTRVFVDRGFLVPVLAAAAAALGIDAACRRAGLGPAVTLLASAAGWAVFVGLVFLPDTLAVGVLPTPDTWRAAQELWVTGLELVRLRPSPTYAEPALVLLAVNGVWAVAHAVDGLVFRLSRPLSGIATALVLWTVPLALAPPGGRGWVWAAPVLLAAAGVLLTAAGGDTGRWGRWVAPDDPGGVRQHRGASPALGALLAVAAVAGGALLADRLPGAQAQPWYELRGMGGTTLTSNPMVGMQQRLVAADRGTVLRVRSTRPVYIRTTSLDVYSDREEWTNSGISGARIVGGRVPGDDIAAAETVELSVDVVNLPDAVLVPAPYQTVEVDGGPAGSLQYDPRLATFTLDRGATLQPGDSYRVRAAIPSPSVEELAAAPVSTDPALTVLPPEVPPRVAELARQIVDARGATTPFDQALAIQDELRTWTYSLEIAPGHGGSAMDQFLDTRSGYCEQFAGTMAVMLRTLGIPARVAVGFTPGTPVGTPDATSPPDEPSTYEISLANAHAWVEVAFPGYGWIAFEPTPRDDGNVLVPTAANLAPEVTAAGEVADPDDPVDPSPLLQPGLEQQEALAQREGLANAEGLAGAPQEPGGGGDRRGVPGLLLAVLGLTGVGGAAAVAVDRSRRRGAAAERDPRGRVLSARAAVGRVGAGLGAAARASETDEEYLGRLADLAGNRRGAPDAARRLARRVEQALWSPAVPHGAVPEGAAEESESAAAALTEALLAGRGRLGRAVVTVRGRAVAAREALAAVWASRPDPSFGDRGPGVRSGGRPPGPDGHRGSA